MNCCQAIDIINTGIVDLLLLVLGFIAGQVTKFKTPIMTAIVVIKMIREMAKWYLETHPKGKKIAKKTDIDERLNGLIDG